MKGLVEGQRDVWLGDLKERDKVANPALRSIDYATHNRTKRGACQSPPIYGRRVLERRQYSTPSISFSKFVSILKTVV